ncbi:UDP-galactopyranose mutase [Bacteroidota bacterium]
MYDFLIVGAGFAGAVTAERIASQLNKKVLLVEKRNHIGGNAYDEKNEYGILVHKYGPHIFHTNSKMVFEYLSRFTDWIPYEHKVLAKHKEQLYPIPINRITLNKLYNLNLQSSVDVEEYYNSVKEHRFPVSNSEDIIINQVGHDLFERFFKYYTKKQWDLYPNELSPSVCGRIPVRINDDCRYFTDKYQFMPKDGYTKMFEKMLDHKNIEIALNTDYKDVINNIKYDRMIYTGPIDYYFDYEFGKLPYRSICFEYKNLCQKYFQSSAQVNYVDNSVKYTRVVEHKYLSKSNSDFTTVSYEYPSIKGEPFYPIPTEGNRNIFRNYKVEMNKQKKVLFCGRLSEYQYYNMDQVIASSLKIFKEMINGK